MSIIIDPGVRPLPGGTDLHDVETYALTPYDLSKLYSRKAEFLQRKIPSATYNVGPIGTVQVVQKSHATVLWEFRKND